MNFFQPKLSVFFFLIESNNVNSALTEKIEIFHPVWKKMQQARIIPKTYQREQYPAF